MTDERRVYSRIPVEMWVEEMRGEDRYFQRSGNLSVGGIFLDGTIPHPKGTSVHLRFTLPGDEDVLTVMGEVIGEPDANRLGMHIKFVDIPDDLDARLRRYLDRAGTAAGA